MGGFWSYLTGPGQSGRNSEQAAGEGAGLGGDRKHKVIHSEKQHTIAKTALTWLHWVSSCCLADKYINIIKTGLPAQFAQLSIFTQSHTNPPMSHNDNQKLFLISLLV